MKPNAKIVPKRGQQNAASTTRPASKTRTSARAETSASQSTSATSTVDSKPRFGADDFEMMEAKSPTPRSTKKGRKKTNKKKQEGEPVCCSVEAIISGEVLPTRAAKRSKVKKTRKETGGGQSPSKKAKLSDESLTCSGTLDSEAEDMKEKKSKEGSGLYVPPHGRRSMGEGAPVSRRTSNAGCCDEDDSNFHNNLNKLEIKGVEKGSDAVLENCEAKESVLDQGRNKANQLKVPAKGLRKVTTGTKNEWEERKKKQSDDSWSAPVNNRPYPHNDWECVQPMASPSESGKGRMPARGDGDDFGVRNTQTRGGRSRPSMGAQKNDQFEEMKKRTQKLYAMTEVEWVDSHCHLDFIYGKVSHNGHLQHFEEWMQSPNFQPFFPPSFKGCIPNFIHPELYTKGLTKNPNEYDLGWIVKQVESKFVYGATYGCHPHKAHLYNDDVHGQLRRFCEEPKIFKTKAIGECGLDYFRMRSPLDDQVRAFKAQLQLVIEFQLPLVIHCRPSANTTDTEDECLRIMQEVGLSRYQNIHRHCFTGNLATAKRWVNTFPNTYFGFTNTVVSFSKEQLEAVANISLDRILLETDAPYFRPQIFDCGDGDKTAFPGMAIATAKALAELRGESLDEVLSATRRNVDRCYAYPSI